MEEGGPCIYLHVLGMVAVAHMLCVLSELREQLLGVYYFPHHVVSRGQIQVVSLGGKCPYPLSHLPSSISGIILFKGYL